MRPIAAWIGAGIAALALHAQLACAELWGFVDEAGVAHFATTRVDDRYELFFKGRTTLDAAENASPAPGSAIERTPLYRRVVAHPNVRRFAALIERSARARGLDPALVKAVVAVESAFEPAAVSPKGALGLMQIVPATGARYGIVARPGQSVVAQLLDPAINIEVGVRYLRDLLDLFDNDRALALAAYNAGRASVRQSGNRVPPFPETREYVERVRQFQAVYAPHVAPPPPRTRLDLCPLRATEPPDSASGPRTTGASRASRRAA